MSPDIVSTSSVAVKSLRGPADSLDMIISAQQTRLAARDVEPPAGSMPDAHPEVSPDLMRRILIVVDAVPEARPDRVVEARQRLALGFPDSQLIAEKIIARAICDALR